MFKIDEEDLKKKLTPEQYKILREKGTEAPFTSALLNVHDKGMFSCMACGQELFASDAKFDSGTGWPSFDQALPGAVEFSAEGGSASGGKKLSDDEHGMSRTEVTCSNCGSHLGHVFDDGPATTTGKRFCINGACLMHQPNKKTS